MDTNLGGSAVFLIKACILDTIITEYPRELFSLRTMYPYLLL